MAEASIPVDLFNPGQVFACLGFLESAEILLGDAEGGFDWSNEADVRFVMRANGEKNPFAYVLEFLAEAEVKALAPASASLTTEKWGVPTATLDLLEPFPFPAPSSPATLPVLLESGRKRFVPNLIIDHWGDATVRDNVKFWAGAGGYPGAALFQDGLNLVRDSLAAAFIDPFSVAAPQSSSFRLDWRRDYIPLEVGFSPNAHGDIAMLGYPIVELLGVVGLTHARPRRFSKLDYGYSVLKRPSEDRLIPPSILRAALGRSVVAFERRNFRFELGWPGQENQARCILDVSEEFIA
jgi:CRISPR-associated protein Csb3